MSFVKPTYRSDPLVRFPNPKLQGEERPAFSSASGATQALNTDLSWMVRDFAGFPLQINHSLGMTTPMNGPEGAFGVYDNFYKGKKALKYDNHGMLLEAVTEGSASAVQMLFGFEYLGVRATGIAAGFAPSVPIHASALAVFTTIGNYLFTAMFFLLAGVGLVQAKRASNFYAEYERNGKDLSALMHCLLVPQEEIARLTLRDKPVLNTLGLIALQERQLSHTLLNMEYAHASLESKDKLLNDLLQTHFDPKLFALKAYYFSRLSEATRQDLSLTEALGLVLKLEKLQANREERAVRALGDTCVQKIKRVAVRGLEMRPIAEKYRLLAEVESSYTKRQRSNIALVLLSLLAGTAGILACVALGPTLWLDIAAAVGFVLLDAANIKDAFNGSPGQHDKKRLLVYALVICVGIAISITSLVLLGGTPLLWGSTLALAGSMLTIYAIALYALHRKEKRWKAEHPTLDTLRERLNSIEEPDKNRPLPVDVLRCFKNLPKATRKALTDEATRHSAFHNPEYRQWDVYSDRLDYGNFDSARQSQIEAERSERGRPFPAGKADEEDRFGKVAASQNSHNLSGRSIEGRFSNTLLQHYFKRDREFTEIEITLLRKAVKKTAKFFWSQSWHWNKDEHFQKQVLALERIREALSLNDAYRHFYEIRDFDIWTVLHENILRVFKREETAQGLITALRQLEQRAIQQIA